jgi:hypothetical protein
MVNVLQRFPNAAGAFGRHIAWPNASAFVKRDINYHFESLLRYPLSLVRETAATDPSLSPERWQQVLHYFSNNNSCLRRSAWERAPFPEVDYGEDQAWADKVIGLGFGKVFVPSAVVYHSHDFSPDEALQRAEIETLFFATTFGYQMYDPDRTFQEQLQELHQTDRHWAKTKGIDEESLELRLLLNEAVLRGRAEGTRKAVGLRYERSN